MKNFLLTFFAVCMLCNGFGQNRKKDQEVDIVNHEVQLGESVRMISKKYMVDPSEIYKLNKFAVEGITQGMILKIPVPKKESMVSKESIPSPDSTTTSTESSTSMQSVSETPTGSKEEIKQIIITERKTEVNHKVLPKETLFSLAKEFDVTVEDIKSNNKETLKNGLQIGQIIVIPTSKEVDIKQSTTIADQKPTKIEKPVAVAETSVGTVAHKVEPKETLYSVARKYNVTVDEIKQKNESLLKNGLQIGQVLQIPTHN